MSDRKQEIVDALTALEARLERWPNKEAWEQDFQEALKEGGDAAFELLRFAGISEREAKAMADPEHRSYESYHAHHNDPAAFAKRRIKTILQEAEGYAVYNLAAYQGFNRADAVKVIGELSPTWTIDEIATVFATGMTDKMREDAIRLLTERGAPRRTKIEDACNKVTANLCRYGHYDRETVHKAVQELSQEWTEGEIAGINALYTRMDQDDDQIIKNIEETLIQRGALKKNDGGVGNPSP